MSRTWSATMARMADLPRMLTLADVAEILNTSVAQVYALVRRKELRAMKLGGRGQWRVRPADLEEFIEKGYADTDKYVDDHPFEPADEPDPEEADR